jgi:hypothetical protein
MESHDEYNGAEGEEMSAYGAHQEYDDDGNNPDPYYAMSAAMQAPQDWDENEDQQGETYTS